MKKYLILQVLLFSIATNIGASVDLTPVIYVNTKISNIDQYPDKVILECDFSTYPAFEYYDMHCSKLQNNKLIKGYKPQYSHKAILAISKSLYEKNDMAKTLSKYKFERENYQDPVVSKSFTLTSMISYYADHNTTKRYTESNETRIYSITSATDDNITLKLDKRIINFEDGTQKTITYKGAEK